MSEYVDLINRGEFAAAIDEVGIANGAAFLAKVETTLAMVLDVLDCIPETHDILERARATSLKIIPLKPNAEDAELEKKGRVRPGYYCSISNEIAMSFGSFYQIERFSSFQDISPVDIFQLKKLTEIVAHEFKHFEQCDCRNMLGAENHFIQSDSTFLGYENVTSLVLLGQIIEADAYAFGTFVQYALSDIIDLKKEGLSNHDIRAMRTQDPTKIWVNVANDLIKNKLKNIDTSYSIAKLKKSIASGSGSAGYYTSAASQMSDDFFQQAYMHFLDMPKLLSRFGDASEALKRNDTAESLSKKFRRCLRQDYLADVSNVDLYKMLLSSVDPDVRKAIWAVEALPRAARRGKSLEEAGAARAKTCAARIQHILKP